MVLSNKLHTWADVQGGSKKAWQMYTALLALPGPPEGQSQSGDGLPQLKAVSTQNFKNLSKLNF